MTGPVRARLAFVGELRAGNVVEARLIIAHPMESGFRTDDKGQRLPKDIIESIEVRLDGKPVLRAELGTGMSAYPFLAFPLVVPAGGGVVSANWIDTSGQRGRIESRLAPT